MYGSGFWTFGLDPTQLGIRIRILIEKIKRKNKSTNKERNVSFYFLAFQFHFPIPAPPPPPIHTSSDAASLLTSVSLTRGRGLPPHTSPRYVPLSLFFDFFYGSHRWCVFLFTIMCVLLIFVFWVSSLLPQSIQVLLFYLLPTKCLTQILTQPVNCLKYVNICLVLILGVPAVLVPLKYLTKVLNFILNCLTILFAPEADFC